MTFVAMSQLLTAALLVGEPFGGSEPPAADAVGYDEARGDELSPTSQDPYEWLAGLLSRRRDERRDAASQLVASGDRSLLPALVDAYFFIPRHDRREARRALVALAEEDVGEHYHAWVEWIGRHGEITPRPGYRRFKQQLFENIDAGYGEVLAADRPATVRLEEIVSGGVPIEGIPALDDPRIVDVASARYLRDDEPVFGVAIGGEARAYPLRFLSWHEMANDTVGGVPVTLSYCTLCGSGVLYDRRRPGGEVLSFGTSGLLYRSNKLMLDRETRSLWSNLTGEPVLGPMLGQPPLALLPMSLTTWEAWLERHPRTTVLAYDRELENEGLRYGYRYDPGAADRARRGVSFPVWQRSERLDRHAEVWALRIGRAAKAYPIDDVLAAGIVEDELGGVALLLVADPESGEVRGYERSGRGFRWGGSSELVDDGGSRWRIGDDALHRLAGDTRLDRLPGHVAFWFGWFAFYPDTEVWQPETATPAGSS